MTAAVAGRPLAGIRDTARGIACGQCGTAPGQPCDGGDGDHLARYVAAARHGLLSRGDIETVLGVAPDVLTPGTLIRVEAGGGWHLPGRAAWHAGLSDDELAMAVYRWDRAAAACYRLAGRHEPAGVIWLGEPWAGTGEEMTSLRDEALAAVLGRLAGGRD